MRGGFDGRTKRGARAAGDEAGGPRRVSRSVAAKDAREIASEPAYLRRGAASMQEALQSFLRENGLSTKLRHMPVFQAWSQVVGLEIARHARPVRFRRGELCVEVESAAHLHELSNFTGERYRELANARLGKPEIQRVVFRLKR